MALSNLHTNYKENYKDDLINLTKERENDLLKGGDLTNLNAQIDETANSIAMGYGYDLFQKYNTITTDLAGLATSKQSNLTNAQAIQAVKDLIATHRVKVGENWQFQAGGGINSLEELQGKINSYITLSTEKNAETLMLKELNSMEAQVKAKTGLSESNELIALVDLAYNGGIGIIGTNLVNAIETNNRAAAWYEIRYASNLGRSYGLQNRREAESNLFGLYSSTDGKTPVNDNEAKNVIRYLESQRSKIATYLSQIKNDKGDINDLNYALSPAKDLLIANYAQGTNIDGNIVVGQGIGQIPEPFADVTDAKDFNDTLQGTDKNDLIFGERGDDTITGGAGSDVIYGGMGTDILSGGSGNDTYTYNKGDGKDTLDDQGDDSADKLLFGTGITTEDLIVTVSGNDIIVSFKNSTEDSITIKNWYTEANRIEYFEFADGTRLNENGIIKLMATDDVDTVKGTENENTLTGGANADTLVDNGEGKDTYLAGAGDTIIDGDGKGRVSFENTMLSGGTYNKNTGTYEGNGGSYSLSGGTLTFTNASGTITIENYSKSADSLGIHLEDKDDEDEENKDTDNILPETSAGEGHNENFSSPLVLDLNGNGTTSTFIAQTKTYFDMDGDGFKERTSWTESSDGLLTLDLNNDGTVTNGSELFGNNTKLANGTLAKDGFEALSQYDLNKDNVIDAKDSIYAHLKVWMDTNSDGISTQDELKTLEELNITSINLNATETSTSEAYNQISDSSSFTQDGQTKTINDVWFYQNKSDTTYDYTTPIKDSVAALPTIEGSGRVKDLQDAMNDDTVLEAKVTNLLTNASSMSFSNFSSAFKDMVARWSGTDTISATSTRGVQYILNHPSGYINTSVVKVKEVYAYARDVAILEAFAGKSFSMVADGVTTSDVIGTEASVAMNEAYKELQYSQMIEFLSDALYGKSLSKDELITKLQTTLTTTPSDTLSTLLLSTMVYRYGLDTLEAFDDTLLSNTTFKTALSTNGISYSINALGEVVGMYGDVQVGSSGDFYLFTCKHFTTLKSLHVRNEIQHKGAQSGEKQKVA